MTIESKTYGLTDDVSSEIPAGCDRISLVTDDSRDDGTCLFQVEKPDGSFYLCDADGDVVNNVGNWTLQRVLADVPTDDNDAFFDAISTTAKRVEDDTTLTLEDKVRYLSTLTTRDHAGRHFTERYANDVLDALEAEGLIAIDRPVHEPTGIAWSQEHWSVEVTPEGVELVEANPEYWDVAG